MKSSILTAGMLLLVIGAGAQEKVDSEVLNYFNIALEHYEQGNLEEAIEVWKFIVDNELGRDSEIYGYSFRNVAIVYNQLEDYKQARKWYKKILDSDLEDNFWIGGLMEPHANFKHRAAISLAVLAHRDSNYTEELHWLQQAETEYRYWGFPGSATNTGKRQAFILDAKTDALINLGREAEAIKAIITELICADYLDSYFLIVENKLFELIDTLHFKTDLNVALEAMAIQQIDETHWEAHFELYGLSYQIPITHVDPSKGNPIHYTVFLIKPDTEPAKADIISEIQSTRFYQRLP